MAYVAISNALINAVQNTVNGMCAKEKDTYKAPPTQVTALHDDPNIERLVWGDKLHLRDQMPEDWKVDVNRVIARITYKIDGLERDFATDFMYTLDAKMSAPNSQNNHSYYGYQCRVSEHSHLLCQAARDHIEAVRFYETTEHKWREVKNKVTEFLNAAKSLNEALKLWPALSLYVPDQYIDKVNNNVKREKTVSKAEEILASISADELTAAAVASKLT